MGMMKRLNLKLYFCLWIVSVAACHASENVPLSDEISNSAQIASKLNMDNAYRSLDLNGRQYVAGFSIDSNGNNHPLLVEFESATGKHSSWHFDDIIADIFLYNASVSVLLDSGKSFSLNNGKWVPNALQLQAGSVIVSSDAKQHLIACSPSSLTMSDTHKGGCESFNPDWKLAFSWHDVVPKVCGNYLYAVTWSAKQNQRLKIDLVSGKVVEQNAFNGGDICTP
jgi:hypothetical protein